MSSPWQIGQVIEDLYEVRDEITSGGMGVVYRVHHRGWNMDLAVKTPKPELVSSAQQITNFETEAQTWVGLGLHPNIVACAYVRRFDGLPRVFAEWVEGGSLSEAIDSGRLYEGGHEQVLARILDVAIQFAWGLDYAHSRGLVHQDVKPANVMLTADWTAKVSDFGLAKARAAAGEIASSEPGASVLAAFAGGMTPGYCSPEQATAFYAAHSGGHPAALTRATDVWSWAISVWEMFTGEPPCRQGGQAADQAFEAFRDDPSVDDPAIPAMPGALTDLLTRCLDPNIATRPRRMADLAGELAETYRQLTGTAYPNTKPDATTLHADALNNQAMSMLDLGQPKRAEQLWEAALSVDAQHPQSSYNRGLFRWRRGEITDAQLVEMLDAVRRSHPSNPLCAQLLGAVHLERSDPRAAKELTGNAVPQADAVSEIPASRALAGHSREVRCLRISDDGSILVSASADGIAQVWDLTRMRCVRSFDTGHKHELSAMAVAANMRVAISTGIWEAALRLWDLPKQRCLHVLGGHDSYANAADVNADGRLAVSGADDGTVFVWDVTAGRVVRELDSHAGAVAILKFVGSGEQVISAGGDDTALRISDVRTGRVVQRLECGGPVHKIVCDASDRYLVSVSSRLRFWDIRTGRCLRTFDDHPGGVRSVRLSADGRLLAVGCAEGEIVVWDVGTGARMQVFARRAAVYSDVAFGPPGMILSADSSGLRAWQLGQGRCLSTVSLSADGPLATTAGGHTAITSGRDGAVAVCAVPSGTGPAAPWQYVRPRSAAEISTAAASVDASITRAQVHLSAGDVTRADSEIRSARTVSGFRRDPRLFDLWRMVGQSRPLGGCDGGWQRHCLTGHSGAVTTVTLSADGRVAVSGGADGSVLAWDVATGRGKPLRAGGDREIAAVQLSSDGATAISANASAPVMVWDTGSGALRRVLEGTDGEVAAALSADGATALTGGKRDGISVWDVGTGDCLRKLTGYHVSGVEALAIDTDARCALSSGYDLLVQWWDMRSGTRISGYLELGGFFTAVLDPGGTLAMIAAREGLVLWDLAAAQRVRKFGHSRTVAWLPQKGVAACDAGATVEVFDVATGQRHAILVGHTARVTSVAISDDAHLVASGSEDGSVRLWALDWDHAAD